MADPAAPADPAALGELAVELALEAGGLIIERAAAARRSVDTKSSPTDLVTAADRASEELIVARVLAARPDDGIAGEEGSNRPGTSGVTWHIDPIDGTTNYVYAIPAFAVSIGVEHDGAMVAAAVVNPVRGQLYRAVRGAGAWRRDTHGGAGPVGDGDGDRADGREGPEVRLTGSPLTDVSTALVATGFSYQPDGRRAQAGVLVELLPRIRDIRRFGSAALDLCGAAAGEVDAYFERGLNRWDFAAGALIAAEAGLQVGGLHGRPPSPDMVLAAPPALFATLRGLLEPLHR